MCFGYQTAKTLALYVRIDLRGGDVGVAEHFLHAAQVGAAIDEMAGEGVSQDVRRNLEAGLARQPGDELAAAPPRQMSLDAARRKQPPRFRIVLEKAIAHGEIGVECASRRP